ncbi:hypothetical protein CHELA1G11_14006 [Hyphomicrobiales bacterium]|nr:hypothetical protein CHELA1G2_10308 [Hyphomicrobiales bacterium]CAH1675564.1 hypothetical protein CHELA1G11_14006 [Hyphomicrobiales bacterium]
MPPTEGRHSVNSKGHVFHVNSKTVITFINARAGRGRRARDRMGMDLGPRYAGFDMCRNGRHFSP